MKQLVAFITSGYPEKQFSVDLALALAQNGVDTLELGVPFSDPVADGPLIEAASHKVLQQGLKFSDVLDITKEVAPKVDTLWMGYFNSFYQQKMPKLLPLAKEMGLSGFIIPDLPYEEAVVYDELFQANNLSNISFVAPTDSPQRIEQIVSNAQKFIYMVAYTGITGSGASEDLQPFLQTIKEYTKTPVFVGFGVNEKTAKQKIVGADGVIVGSAFTKVLLEEDTNFTQKIQKCCDIASIIKEEINS